jgi:hypothetical protein
MIPAQTLHMYKKVIVKSVQFGMQYGVVSWFTNLQSKNALMAVTMVLV